MTYRTIYGNETCQGYWHAHFRTGIPYFCNILQFATIAELNVQNVAEVVQVSEARKVRGTSFIFELSRRTIEGNSRCLRSVDFFTRFTPFRFNTFLEVSPDMIAE